MTMLNKMPPDSYVQGMNVVSILTRAAVEDTLDKAGFTAEPQTMRGRLRATTAMVPVHMLLPDNYPK